MVDPFPIAQESQCLLALKYYIAVGVGIGTKFEISTGMQNP